MKRKLLQIVLVSLGTMAVVAGGFLLPGVVSDVQEASSAQNITYHEIDQAQFTVATTDDHLEVFRFAASGFYFSLELAEGNEYTPETMTDHAFETLNALADKGFTEASAADYQVKNMNPVLAISEEKQEARVLWECFLVHNERTDENFYMLFEDASGTLVGLEYSAILTPEYGAEREIGASSALVWAEALAQFYQVEKSIQQDADEVFGRADLIAYSPLEGDLVIGYSFLLEGSSISSSPAFRDDAVEIDGDNVDRAWLHFAAAPFFLSDFSFAEENGIDPTLFL